MDFRAQFFNAGSNIRGADAQSIRFSRRVDISKNNCIGCGKCLGKLIQERFGAGIGVGLEYTPQLLVWIIVRCL